MTHLAPDRPGMQVYVSIEKSFEQGRRSFDTLLAE